MMMSYVVHRMILKIRLGRFEIKKQCLKLLFHLTLSFKIIIDDDVDDRQKHSLNDLSFFFLLYDQIQFFFLCVCYESISTLVLNIGCAFEVNSHTHIYTKVKKKKKEKNGRDFFFVNLIYMIIDSKWESELLVFRSYVTLDLFPSH